MHTSLRLSLALGLVAAPFAVPCWAQDLSTPAALPAATPSPAPPGAGLTELSDEELAGMRGRYTVSDNTVAWFGVTMVSNWQTGEGQVLQSRLSVALDVRTPAAPKLVFQPHVSITAADAPLPTPDGVRSIDASGLANASGLVQSVQVAGDANRASNVARISVRRDAAVPGMDAAAVATPGQGTQASAFGMLASAVLEDHAARVLLQIDGHGAVEQWVGRSGLGQTIQLSGDGHAVSNWMEIDLVRGASTRAPLGQNVAQAIALSRAVAIGY